VGRVLNSVHCKSVMCGRHHKHCSGVKGSPIRFGDALVCKLWEKVGEGENINIQESMDLENGVCLDRVGKFCYLEHMLSGVG